MKLLFSFIYYVVTTNKNDKVTIRTKCMFENFNDTKIDRKYKIKINSTPLKIDIYKYLSETSQLVIDTSQ